jgi:hypothetical protein
MGAGESPVVAVLDHAEQQCAVAIMLQIQCDLCRYRHKGHCMTVAAAKLKTTRPFASNIKIGGHSLLATIVYPAKRQTSSTIATVTGAGVLAGYIGDYVKHSLRSYLQEGTVGIAVYYQVESKCLSGSYNAPLATLIRQIWLA